MSEINKEDDWYGNCILIALALIFIFIGIELWS